MQGKKRVKKSLAKFIAALFPELCIICKREVVPEDAFVCDECAEKLAREQGRICVKCGRAPFLCDCGMPKDIDAMHSVLWYGGSVRGFILSMKKQRYEKDHRYVAKRLASLVEGVEEYKSAKAIAYVPRSLERKRRFGSDHNEEIAKQLSQMTGIPVGNYLASPEKSLEQKSLSAAQRRKNVKNSFSLTDEKPPEVIILIDDVFTTGATCGECARMLKKAGAKKIYGLFFAKSRNI